MELIISENLSNDLIDALTNLGYRKNSRNEFSKYYRSDGFRVFINADSGECYGEMNASPFEMTDKFKFINDVDTLLDLDAIAQKTFVGIMETPDEYTARMSK